VVEFFFQFVSKWLKWLSQTLHPFSHILTFFSGIRAPIAVPPSNGFQICSMLAKGIFFPEKKLQTSSKSAYKCQRKYVSDTAVKKHHTLSSYTDVRSSISTKLCLVIKEVRAIISSAKGFWIRSVV